MLVMSLIVSDKGRYVSWMQKPLWEEYVAMKLKTEAELEFAEACQQIHGLILLLMLPIRHDIFHLKWASGVAQEEEAGSVEVIVRLGLEQQWTEKLKQRIISGHRSHEELFKELTRMDIRNPGPLPGVGKINVKRWQRVLAAADARSLDRKITFVREYLEANKHCAHKNNHDAVRNLENIFANLQ